MVFKSRAAIRSIAMHDAIVGSHRAIAARSARAVTRRTLMSRLARATQIVRGIDERDVRERLREVSDLSPALDVVLLCQQPDVVADGEQPLEQSAGVVDAAHDRVRIREPE